MSVRYLLHRVFVARHGWVIRGLDASARNYTPPPARKAVGPEAAQIFQLGMNTHKLTLREIAVLAGTLESLVHEEAVERLERSYHLMGIDLELSKTSQMPTATNTAAIDLFMLLYVHRLDHAVVTLEDLAELWRTTSQKYPHWDETLLWTHVMRHKVLEQNQGLDPGSYQVAL